MRHDCLDEIRDIQLLLRANTRINSIRVITPETDLSRIVRIIFILFVFFLFERDSVILFTRRKESLRNGHQIVRIDIISPEISAYLSPDISQLVLISRDVSFMKPSDCDITPAGADHEVVTLAGRNAYTVGEKYLQRKVFFREFFRIDLGQYSFHIFDGIIQHPVLDSYQVIVGLRTDIPLEVHVGII